MEKMFKRKEMLRIFPEETWNDLQLQIIWYGREYPVLAAGI
jgi:endonuclease III